MMKHYCGTKMIDAEPMNRLEFNAEQGVKIPSSDAHAGDEGYKVVYEDGYVSWSPKEVFEKAYKETNALTFGMAIEAMKDGFHLARRGWNGKGIFVELQVPDAHSKMTHPYIFIDTTGLQTDNPDAPKDRVPWLASQTDMLANDWCIVGK
jgi:hypothetical protein